MPQQPLFCKRHLFLCWPLPNSCRLCSPLHSMPRLTDHVPIKNVAVNTYTIPTEMPESDGTLEWDKTTIVIVEAGAGGASGLGYTYADTATAKLIHDLLADVVRG